MENYEQKIFEALDQNIVIDFKKLWGQRKLYCLQYLKVENLIN